MRLSTQQFFRQGVASITDLTAQTKRVQQQISSGQRLQTAADDPIAAMQILQLEKSQAIGEQYTRNIDIAESRLQEIEGSVSSMETVLQRIRELVLQGANGPYSNEERSLIGFEMRERIGELAALANTRGRDGDYIFAGFEVDQPPFVETANGFRYNGDDGVQRVQIASSTFVDVSEPGSRLFANIPVENNRIETFVAASNVSGVSVNTEAVIDQAIYDSNFPDDYVITFGNVGNIAPPGPNYSVTRQSDGALLQANVPFDVVTGINFGGFEVSLSGVPAAGDQFVVRSSDTNDMLSTLQEIADGIASFDNTQERDAFIADAINNVDAIQDSLAQGRARVGARLNILDTTRNTIESAALSNQDILSDIRDLDYAEAVSNLSFLSFVLEASQQSLARISGLSLFNFLR